MPLVLLAYLSSKMLNVSQFCTLFFRFTVVQTQPTHWDGASTVTLRENQQGEHAPAAEQVI